MGEQKYILGCLIISYVVLPFVDVIHWLVHCVIACSKSFFFMCEYGIGICVIDIAGFFVVSTASLSAASLPTIPEWDFTQDRKMDLGDEFFKMDLISNEKAESGLIDSRTCKFDWLSVRIWALGKVELINQRSAMRIACCSAWKMLL